MLQVRRLASSLSLSLHRLIIFSCTFCIHSISVLTILLMVYPISVLFCPPVLLKKNFPVFVLLFVNCRFNHVFILHIIYFQKIKPYLHFYIYLHFTTQLICAFYLAMDYKDTKPYMSAFILVDLLTEFAAFCLVFLKFLRPCT